MSMKASGSVGPRLTFSQRKSGQQVRFQRAQNDVITDERTVQRLKYTTAVASWNGLDGGTKDTFDTLVVGQHMTGYNLFIKLHMLGSLVDGDASFYGFRNYGILIYGKQA